ncbi:MAG TPA: DUF6788 family protein [Bryobacteraceae bacterium]|nr:DUF6788 family protein [Bryobacteraceae bacterium]
MPDKPTLSRTAMSPRERAFRSRLAQIVSGQGLIRGTLLERMRSCGKPTCRCANGGPRHRGVSLVLSGKGKLRQLHIPADWEQRVRQWVENHHTLRGLLAELSEIHWDKVRRRRE